MWFGFVFTVKGVRQQIPFYGPESEQNIIPVTRESISDKISTSV